MKSFGVGWALASTIDADFARCAMRGTECLSDLQNGTSRLAAACSVSCALGTCKQRSHQNVPKLYYRIRDRQWLSFRSLKARPIPGIPVGYAVFGTNLRALKKANRSGLA